MTIIRPDNIDEEDEAWQYQVSLLSEDILGWSGNHASILQYTISEFADLRTRGERLFDEIARDGINVSFRPSESLFENAQ